MPMNQEIKAAWAADLCSGEYEQGHGYLRTDDTYCCLGVLCERGVTAGVLIRTGPDERGVYTYAAKGDRRDSSNILLPEAVERWANMGEADPMVAFDGRHEHLSHLNDGSSDPDNPIRRHTLAEIAELIKADDNI